MRKDQGQLCSAGDPVQAGGNLHIQTTEHPPELLADAKTSLSLAELVLCLHYTLWPDLWYLLFALFGFKRLPPPQWGDFE